jgi:hypothetical protein
MGGLSEEEGSWLKEADFTWEDQNPEEELKQEEQETHIPEGSQLNLEEPQIKQETLELEPLRFFDKEGEMATNTANL